MEEVENLTIYPRLTGKTVVVTGASAGIGVATAIHFAACGANLILLARRKQKLEKLKSDITSRFPTVNVFIFQLDVTNQEHWKNLTTCIPDNLKQVHILVNNAGKALDYTHLVNYKSEHVSEMLDVNVKGAIMAIQTFVPAMKQNGEGHIINLSSIAGKTAYPNGSIYCASKFALEGLNDSLRQELVDTPLRVTKISPGSVVNTEFSLVRFMGDKATADKVYQGFDPLLACDIADNIVYAASRPPHVQIADLLVFPTAQASATLFHRVQKL
eukprot:TRINITY_DN3784_c0_g1_i1.p1 TRINITY_DN3784_c0_g1~~TRINITY_DN3784_c0_g1_i1.p1  ORF type:complete len:271 (-),score=37.33 TRINITY_DN3784_c0_g1_i1:40-852(-)